MNAESFKAAVADLIAKVVGGKALDAFDQYYADDVTMQENEQPPRVGKAACRAFEVDFFSKIKAVRTYVCDDGRRSRGGDRPGGEQQRAEPNAVWFGPATKHRRAGTAVAREQPGPKRWRDRQKGGARHGGHNRQGPRRY